MRHESAESLGAAGQRLGRVRVVVQLAEAGDVVDDATAIWPGQRSTVKFGTLTIAKRVDELATERRKIVFDPAARKSSNDSFPTAMNLAAVLGVKQIDAVGQDAERCFGH
jgi:hypothetical protein